MRNLQLVDYILRVMLSYYLVLWILLKGAENVWIKDMFVGSWYFVFAVRIWGVSACLGLGILYRILWA